MSLPYVRINKSEENLGNSIKAQRNRGNRIESGHGCEYTQANRSRTKVKLKKREEKAKKEANTIESNDLQFINID